MTTNNLNRDALIVGICQYGDLPMSAQLDTLAKQAEQFAQLLETQGGFKVRRLPCTHDTLKLSFSQRLAISDTIFPDGRRNQFGLEKAIEDLFYPANPSPDQVALLFFAGHGLLKSTKAGTEGFLATSEVDGRSVYGISLKWLRDLLRNSPVKQQVVFLESCHSGEFFTHFQADEKRDYCFVTSARAHEAALAEGLLTKALLDILDYTHQPKDTPWVNSDTLIENLQQQLTTAEGWQRFEMQTQGHLMLTNYAFSQQVDPNAKPYKGLRYFDNKPEDALFFKGRDKLIAELLTKVKTKPFLAVLGASGNGKSSVVRAGVLYQLQQTGSCEIVNPFTPTATPLTALTNGLVITEIVALVNASTKARVILTIDQFEEVFSLCQDPQARDTFFNTLLDAVEQAAGKLCLIVVMRADFMDKCSQYPRLARYFQDHQHLVTPPTEAEIQQIIEAPAKQAGFLVEPRLVAEMATDFKDSLGGLPLLEFALTTLWEKGKADRLLRYADYQALGGIQGILEKKATETYEKTLTPAEQVVAKRIFLELTELGEGKPDTRRLVLQTDLLGLTTTQTSVESVIAKLVKEHLIVTDKTAVTVVNIAHDALIEHWSVLRKWLDQSREDLKLQRQINEGAKAWKEGKKALLVGVDLARAEEYLGTHLEKVPLSEVGVEFVKASLQAQRRQRRWKRAGVASLIVTTVGLASYGYWYFDSYVWEHITYCNTYAKRFGIMECVGELTITPVHEELSYKFVQKGRKGPVWKVQAVRSSKLTLLHKVNPYFERNSPGSQWEFILDANGKIFYENIYNQSNELIHKLVYPPVTERQWKKAYYVDDKGLPQSLCSGAEYVEFHYSGQGYEEEIHYLDCQGKPKPGDDKIFVKHRQFDERGLMTEESYFDEDGKTPKLNKYGYQKITQKPDDLGNITEVAFFDLDGQPTLSKKDGYHKGTFLADAGGNNIKTNFSDTKGQPTLPLPEGVAVFYIFMLDNNDQVTLILKSNNGSQLIVPNFRRDQLIETVNQLMEKLRTPGAYQSQREERNWLLPASQLYQWLIKPITAELENQKIDTIVMVPSGILTKLPFAALYDDESHKYLIEKYALAINPAGNQLTDFTKTEPQDRPRALLIGIDKMVSQSSPPLLKNTKQELEEINQVLGGDVLYNEQATRSHIVTTLRNTPYSIIHFSNHVVFKENSEESFLPVYDGLLNMGSLGDIISSSAERLEMVTFSAYETAVGDEQSALGLAGLAVHAGARSALGSLWNVNEITTTMLMRDFYRQWQWNHLSKAKALREAQLNILRESNFAPAGDDKFKHPFYWAAFVLTGNWQ